VASVYLFGSRAAGTQKAASALQEKYLVELGRILKKKFIR
jgi:predicted nucleotidyltransferase